MWVSIKKKKEKVKEKIRRKKNGKKKVLNVDMDLQKKNIDMA